MLNKRNKYNQPIGPFKSYTDINNYNNFLLELDKKNRNNTTSTTNISTNNTTNSRKNVDGFIKTVNNTFTESEHTNKMFTGINPLENGLTSWEALLLAVEKRLDPNLYESYKGLSNPSERKIIYNMNSATVNTQKKEETVNIPIYKNKINIVTEINDISDLLTLIETYPDIKDTEYNINMSALHKIKTPLTELNNMIGMKDLKENIVNQIIFYIQNLHTLNSDIKGNDFMHTVIYGPPGTGKTEIAKIIGSIFSKMGILTKGTFKKVTRADLIAGYLGQTALKTRDVVKESLGGVLFIDEAYALGNEEKKDSFSKECIDTLCESLSDHKDNLMVIIAGYETDLNNCFFNYNQGLNSRFTWRFKTDEYTAEDLYKIFIKKVNDGGWTLANDSNIDIKWFEKNKTHFKFYGRDIETLFAKTKIAHSRRVFCLDPSVKKHLTVKDVDKGLEMYLKNEDSKNKEKENFNKIINSMYV